MGIVLEFCKKFVGILWECFRNCVGVSVVGIVLWLYCDFVGILWESRGTFLGML